MLNYCQQHDEFYRQAGPSSRSAELRAPFDRIIVICGREQHNSDLSFGGWIWCTK